MNLKICYLKIDVSCEVSVNFISHLTKCHAWHATSTLSPPGRWQGDSQKTREAKRLKCCACHAKWRRGSPKCCAGQLIFWKRREPATKKTTCYETCWCWNVTKRHACHAKRGYATFETSKSDCFAELATGTVILLSRRSLADTCERLKAQRTRFNPQTPKVKREPFAAFRNKCKLCCLLDVSRNW